MSENAKAFWVGIVGLATLGVTGLLVLWNSDFATSPFRDQYQLQLLVPRAPGVGPDTPVRRRGLLIGRVAEVEAVDDGALITVNIDEGKGVKTNEIPRVQTSLIGDAVVEFVPAGPADNAVPVEPGGPAIKGDYNPNPVDLLAEMQGDLRQTIISLGRAGDEVAELADRMNTVLGGQDVERLGRVVEKLELALSQFGQSMAHVDDIIGDEELKQNIREGIAQLPSMVADARAIFEALETAALSADQNLKNLQGFTGPLGERGPEIVSVLEQSVGNLEALLAGAAGFIGRFNASEGLIGRLLNDPEFSDETQATIRNANLAICQLREVIANVNVVVKRLRPIIDDATVIADKVARDPARVARGVVNRETPLGHDVKSYRRPPFVLER